VFAEDEASFAIEEAKLDDAKGEDMKIKDTVVKTATAETTKADGKKAESVKAENSLSKVALVRTPAPSSARQMPIPSSSSLMRRNRSSSPTSSDGVEPPSKRRSSRPSATSSMMGDVKGVMLEMAASIRSDPTGPSETERITTAIRMISKDEEFTLRERVRIIALFRKDLLLADTYLATDDTELRSEVMRDALLDG